MAENDLQKTNHAPGRGRIYGSILETIGDTPIVRLDKQRAPAMQFDVPTVYV